MIKGMCCGWEDSGHATKEILTVVEMPFSKHEISLCPSCLAGFQADIEAMKGKAVPTEEDKNILDGIFGPTSSAGSKGFPDVPFEEFDAIFSRVAADMIEQSIISDAIFERIHAGISSRVQAKECMFKVALVFGGGGDTIQVMAVGVVGDTESMKEDLVALFDEKYPGFKSEKYVASFGIDDDAILEAAGQILISRMSEELDE